MIDWQAIPIVPRGECYVVIMPYAQPEVFQTLTGAILTTLQKQPNWFEIRTIRRRWFRNIATVQISRSESEFFLR